MSTEVLPTTSSSSSTTTSNTTANTAATVQAKAKRKRRAPPSGAAEDCHTCRANGRTCDRRRPYCTQCIDLGGTCAGYRTQLTWNIGVASRGKLRGLTLPIPLTKEEQALRNAAQSSAAAKKEEKKKLKIATTSAGISKSVPASVAAAASLASLRNMNYDFVNLEQNNSCTMSIPGRNIQKTVLTYNPASMVTSHPSPAPYSPLPGQQYAKLMSASPSQGNMAALCSPMSEYSTGQPFYHHDGTTTPTEVYSPMYSPVDSTRSDSGFLDSPFHSRNNSGDYDYLDYTHRPHSQHIPTSVPGHMNDIYEDGHNSPSIYSQHSEQVGSDGGLSALLYDGEMQSQVQPYLSRSHTMTSNYNGTSPQNSHTSPHCSPSPPPLVPSHGTPSSTYYHAYSPSSPQDINTPPPMSGVPAQLQLANSYPPTPSSLSPSVPPSPLYCQQIPTSSAGTSMPLASPGLVLPQQMYPSHQTQPTYILPGTTMNAGHYYMSHLN